MAAAQDAKIGYWQWNVILSEDLNSGVRTEGSVVALHNLTGKLKYPTHGQPLDYLANIKVTLNDRPDVKLVSRMLLHNTGHSNVVIYYCYDTFDIEDTTYFRLAMEPLGSAEDNRALDAQDFSTIKVRPVFRQVIEGVAFLHKNECLKCNIRPSNILLIEGPQSGQHNKYTVKLTDYAYNPKEDHPYETDMQACGGILGYMLTNKGSNYTESEIAKYMMRDEFKNGDPGLAFALVSGCTSDKYTAEVALYHPYLWSDNKILRYVVEFVNRVGSDNTLKERFNRSVSIPSSQMQEWRKDRILKSVCPVNSRDCFQTLRIIRNYVTHFQESKKEIKKLKKEKEKEGEKFTDEDLPEEMKLFKLIFSVPVEGGNKMLKLVAKFLLQKTLYRMQPLLRCILKFASENVGQNVPMVAPPDSLFSQAEPAVDFKWHD